MISEDDKTVGQFGVREICRVFGRFGISEREKEGREWSDERKERNKS